MFVALIALLGFGVLVVECLRVFVFCFDISYIECLECCHLLFAGLLVCLLVWVLVD